MKKSILFVILLTVFISQAVFTQTMNVFTKTGSNSFKLSDIDSINFIPLPAGQLPAMNVFAKNGSASFKLSDIDSIKFSSLSQSQIISMDVLTNIGKTSFKLSDIDSIKILQPETNANSTKVSGTISSSEIGGSSLTITSGFKENAPISNGQFSTEVSKNSTQLLLVTDSEKKLRGLTLSKVLNNNPALLKCDATSTAYSMLMLTPGILATDPQSTESNLNALSQLTSFPPLVNYLKTNLPNRSLDLIFADGILDTLITSCVKEFIAKISTNGKISLSINKTQDEIKNNFLVNPLQDKMELKNYGMRYVNVYRRDIGFDGKEKSILTLKKPMNGGTPISWGSILTFSIGQPTIIYDTDFPPNSDIQKSEVWVIGPGTDSKDIPPSTISIDDDDALLNTLCFYVAFPVLDIISGTTAMLGQSSGNIKKVVDILSGIRASDAKFVSICAKLKTSLKNGDEIASAREIINLAVMVLNYGLSIGAFAEFGISAALAVKLVEVLAVVSVAMGVGNGLAVGLELISTERFTLFNVNNPAAEPNITGVSPGIGRTGDLITIKGKNFGTTRFSKFVSFNTTQAAEYDFWSDTEIRVKVPAGVKEGSGYIVIDAGGIKSNAFTFTIQPLTAPVLATTSITNITQTTATGGGNISSDGGATVTARGICWSMGSTPTIANSKTTDGTGTGSFTSSITGLTSNTIYYVRAYATNSSGTGYGSAVSFTTLQSVQLPLLTTSSVSSITQTTASCGGNITSSGGGTVTTRGVCWSTSSTPTIANSKTTDGNGTGSFTSNITGLTSNTTYYVRAYATNSIGTGYGSALSFTTLQSVQIPVLTTSSVSSITQTTASCGGNITSASGGTVTARGVCWSTGSTPTIANSKTTDGTGTGNFTSNITGLTVNTTYYVRAYATNSVGTGYGSAVSFTTQAGTGGTVTDIDGNVYHTVTIGTQVWMLENLKTTKYRDGSSIPNVTDNTAWTNLTTGAYCNYNNDVSNANTYGRLYNWYAVNDSRKIAPTGWHVATDAEWTTLTTYLGGASIAGGKLKEAGTSHWLSPNTGATNESGFTSLPGGYRSSNNGAFYDIGSFGFWWSSTEYDTYDAWYRYMYFDYGNVFRINNSKRLGFSVRCVRD